MRIFFMFLFSLSLMPSCIANELENMVRGNLSMGQGFVTTENSAQNVPFYSREAAESEGNKFAIQDDGALKSEANRKIAEANADKKSTASTSIVTKAMERKPLDGFENHSMFQRADKIWSDPLTMLNEVMAGNCKERLNEKKNHYTKRIYKEKKYDTEVEEQICEKSADNIVCEKTLNVSNEGTEKCEIGEIALDHIDGLEWTYSASRLSLKTSEGLLPYSLCSEKTITVFFTVSDISKIGKFVLTNVSLLSLLQVKLNGHIVYNSLGGSKLDVLQVQRYGAVYWKCGNKEGSYGNVVDAGNGDVFCTYYVCSKIDVRHVDKDLRRQLIKGKNTLEIKAVWGGHRGYVDMEMEVQCTKLTDTWVKRCWQE